MFLFLDPRHEHDVALGGIIPITVIAFIFIFLVILYVVGLFICLFDFLFIFGCHLGRSSWLGSKRWLILYNCYQSLAQHLTKHASDGIEVSDGHFLN